MRSVIPRLFRGKQSFVTTCRACGRQSAASSATTDYYEMPVQVVGFKSLVESMVGLRAVHTHYTQ